MRVLCLDNDSERYDGQYWSENIDSIVELNGEKVDGKTLSPDCLKDGDKIKYVYQKREWKGIVATKMDDNQASQDKRRKRQRKDELGQTQTPKKHRQLGKLKHTIQLATYTCFSVHTVMYM